MTVLFASQAGELVLSTFSVPAQIYARDVASGINELISKGTSGGPSNDNSQAGRMTPDGRFVVFHSDATDLVPLDLNGMTDIFLHDRTTGVTELISVTSWGTQATHQSRNPSVSDDGRFVAFHSKAKNLDSADAWYYNDIFVRDRLLGTTDRVSLGMFGGDPNEDSAFPSISADGLCIAYWSLASNLIFGDTNSVADFFVTNRLTGLTERVSVNSSGLEGTYVALPGNPSDAPDISGDGRFVVYRSFASDLVSGDTNGVKDIFVRDRLLGTTTRVSVSSSGAEAAFPVSVTPDQRYPSISAGGKVVVFCSNANNLVPGDDNSTYDVFAHNLQTGITERISIASDGTEGSDVSVISGISPDGRYVAFTSWADNLVPNDTNHWRDSFLHDRMTGGPALSLSNVVAGQTATFGVSGASPGGLVFVGISLVGQGPIPSAWGPLELGSLDLILPFAADGTGAITVPIAVPLSLAGLPLWVQGIDFTMDFPTSVWGGVIQ